MKTNVLNCERTNKAKRGIGITQLSRLNYRITIILILHYLSVNHVASLYKNMYFLEFTFIYMIDYFSDITLCQLI